MDELSTKSIIIGISIFLTLFIVTLVIFEFDQISSIYKNVAETDISFENRLDEFDKYRNSSNEFNGLDVRNTIEKYKEVKNVEVCVNGVCTTPTITVDEYTDKFYSTFEKTTQGFKINFIGK